MYRPAEAIFSIYTGPKSQRNIFKYFFKSYFIIKQKKVEGSNKDYTNSAKINLPEVRIYKIACALDY